MKFFVQGRFGSVRKHEESPLPTVHFQQVPEGKVPIQSKRERTKKAKLSKGTLPAIVPHSPLQTNVFGTTLVSIPHLETLPEAGRLRLCLVNWKRITSDPWIWHVVRGYSLELVAEPRQNIVPRPIQFTRELNVLISGKVQELKQRSAIQKVSPVPDQFISQIFLVPKKDGSQRPVVNLKSLNCLIVKCRFKMESAATLRHLVRRNDWMVSIDLKDAYLSVPIEQRSRKFLRFVREGSLYEF